MEPQHLILLYQLLTSGCIDKPACWVTGHHLSSPSTQPTGWQDIDGLLVSWLAGQGSIYVSDLVFKIRNNNLWAGWLAGWLAGWSG